MMRDPDLARDSDLPGVGRHPTSDGRTIIVSWEEFPNPALNGWYWRYEWGAKHGPYLTDHAAAQAGLDAERDS